MRRLVCAKCAHRLLPAGVRVAAKATMFEPGEIQRLVLGRAKQPTQEQRWVAINGDAHRLTTDYYECDNCDARIRPGDLCAGWSVWREGGPEVPAWEAEFLAPESGLEGYLLAT